MAACSHRRDEFADRAHRRAREGAPSERQDDAVYGQVSDATRKLESPALVRCTQATRFPLAEHFLGLLWPAEVAGGTVAARCSIDR
jgi:hypothetical protein